MGPALFLGLAVLLASPRAQGPWGVAYAPADARAPAPAIVFLHGMWAGPESACPSLEPAATPFGLLVCPRGNAPSGDGSDGTMWAGTFADASRSIRAALDAAEGLAPRSIDCTRGGTLIGYSNGAYFAAEVASSEPGRWPGLVLLSMKLDVDPARLRAARVRRVVLAAGERDDARASMEDLARRVDDAGVEARFVSLGSGGHPLPPDVGTLLCEPVAWVRGADSSRCAP